MTKQGKVDKLRLEAQNIVNGGGGEFSLRSCWKCNPAHKHLKKSDYPILCHICGHWYYKGVDLTIYDKPTK